MDTKPLHPPVWRPDGCERIALVLQGGGALGAYQAGVYQALHEAGLEPDWISGVSIGAVNAAIIAGNAKDNRLDRLREFWTRITDRTLWLHAPDGDIYRQARNAFSSFTTAMFGQPGFFAPHKVNPWFVPAGAKDATSYYDTTPLLETLNELVDFRYLNRKDQRFSVGAVNVLTGNFIFFDNKTDTIVPEHVMASGALPPGFPMVEIGTDYYWDGGIVSNTPLWYVLDDDPHLNAMIAQIDLFSARGEPPQNLDEVLERQKDIQYSSKTRFNTNRVKELEGLRTALAHLLKKLPKRLADDPDVTRLADLARGRHLSIVHLINRRMEHSTQSKDYEFSRATVEALWDAGRNAVHRTLKNPDWKHACRAERGMRAFDLTF